MDLTQAKLDYDYLMSPSKHARRLSCDEVIDYHVKFCSARSKIARTRSVNGDYDIRYVKDDYSHRETNPGLDIIYPPSESKLFSEKDLVVYVHGGYWQECHKDMYTFVGETFASLGYICGIVGYNLAPKVQITDIVEECRLGIACAIRKVKPDRVFLIGWSAGAQLVTSILRSDWAPFGINVDVFKGVIALSGIFDLRPLLSTYINKPLALTEVTATELSPALKIREIKAHCPNCKFLCLFAEFESPVLKAQAQEFSKALNDENLLSAAKQINGVDHFSFMENFINPDGEEVQTILKFIEDCQGTPQMMIE